MSGFEYKVVPAPTKGLKAKGVKTAEDRFAYALQSLMNELGAEGWEYQRADTLPSIERSGLAKSTTEWRNMLVFRRALASEIPSEAPGEIPSEIKAVPRVSAPLPVAPPITADPPAEEVKNDPQDIDIPSIYSNTSDDEWDEQFDGPRPGPQTDPTAAARSMMRDPDNEPNSSLVNLAHRRRPESPED